ncbi:MAG: hypothetical protein WCI95_07095 [bacterium]
MLLTVILTTQTNAASVNLASTIDCGGQRSSSAHYQQDDSIGGIVGVASVGVPNEVARHGYVGQLLEVTNLTITASALSVPETGSVQLGGFALLDDGTAMAVDGLHIIWNSPVVPVSTISVNGVATTATVAVDTAALVSGSYLGVYGSGSFLVLNITAQGTIYSFR